ncbi:hypothetical protein Tco_0699093, partial [Tanacetum coccineum]
HVHVWTWFGECIMMEGHYNSPDTIIAQSSINPFEVLRSIEDHSLPFPIV